MKMDLKYIFALILSIAGLSATIWYANLPPATKSLTLDVLSKSSLSKVSNSELPGLKILVDDKELKNPALTVVTIRNNGTIPVRKDDFEEDITIQLGSEAEPIRSTVVESQPDWIKPKVFLDKSQIHVAPILLNPEDSITINILSDGLPNSISSHSRVAGLKEILVVNSAGAKHREILSYIMLFAAFFAAIPTMGLILSLGPKSFPPAFRISRPLWIVLVILLMLLVAGLTISAAELLGVNIYWKQLLIIYAIAIISIPFALLIKRLPPESDKSVEDT